MIFAALGPIPPLSPLRLPRPLPVENKSLQTLHPSSNPLSAGCRAHFPPSQDAHTDKPSSPPPATPTHAHTSVISHPPAPSPPSSPAPPTAGSPCPHT